MQDPERLLSVASETDPLEREVLTALRQAQAPAHARAAAWSGIAAGIAAAALPATASGTAAASASSSAASKAALGAGAKLVLGSATKVALAATLATAALGGAYVYYERVPATRLAPAPSLAPSPARASSSPPAAPSTPLATHEPSQPVAAVAPQVSAAHASAKDKTRDSLNEAPPRSAGAVPLAEESALLGSARSELRNGDAAAAEATLKRLRQRFPRGVLLQERQVLAIEVLAARGETAAAKQQARAFVQRYPNSPHSTKLRLLLTGSGTAPALRGGASSP